MADPNFTPEQWLAFLEPQLDAQAKAVQVFIDYYNGDHKLAMATQKFRDAFARYFPPMANNWMKLVVDAPVSRLTVQGFRFATDDPDTDDEDATQPANIPAVVPGMPAPPQTVPNPQPKKVTPPWELDADDEAWDIWQASNLDSLSRMIHTDVVKLGITYVSVMPVKGKEHSRISPEHPTQVYVAVDPEDRITRLAGLKRWTSEFDGMCYADVYMPEGRYRFISSKPAAKNGSQARGSQWVTRGSVDDPREGDFGDDDVEFQAYPGGVVPLIPFENRPDLLLGGQSDLADAIGIQDCINKLCLDLMVTSEFHAYPQRYATGWEKAVDDKGRSLSNREVEIYLSQNRMVRAESPDTKFGEFAQANMQNYIEPINMYIEHLAAQSQTPLYYLKAKTGTVSADAMHAMDQGLVDRCKAIISALSDPWEGTLRCAFLQEEGVDSQKGTAESAEVIWDSPESESLAVKVQAAVMMRQSLSIPIEMIWGDVLGWSPQKIRLARDLMNLPPGGPANLGFGSGMGPGHGPIPPTPGSNDPNENDPNAHPGNQPGQPSHLASQGSPSEHGQ